MIPDVDYCAECGAPTTVHVPDGGRVPFGFHFPSCSQFRLEIARGHEAAGRAIWAAGADAPAADFEEPDPLAF